MNFLQRLTVALFAGACVCAHALDQGPRIMGCDYRFGKDEGVDKCLIVGNGMNQGQSWVVFEVRGRRFRFNDSEPGIIEKISSKGDTLQKLKGRNEQAQCRPGAKEADAYVFSNGDRVCLYWE